MTPYCYECLRSYLNAGFAESAIQKEPTSRIISIFERIPSLQLTNNTVDKSPF